MPNEAVAENPLKMLMWRAADLEREGKWLHAVQCYRQAIDEYPEHVPAYVQLSAIYVEHGKIRAAQDALRGGLVHVPDDGRLNLALGNVYLAEEDYEHAVTRFRATLAEEPGNSRALFGAGLALTRSSRNAEAISCLKKLWYARADYPGLAELLGGTYLAVNEVERAIEVLLPAETREPDNGKVVYLTGLAFSLLEQWHDAIPRLRRASVLRPDDPEIMRALGWTYVKLQDFGEAEAWLDRAVQARPDYLAAHMNLAVLYLMQGRNEQGWETLNVAWNLDPTNEHLAAFMRQWRETGTLPETISIEVPHGTHRKD